MTVSEQMLLQLKQELDYIIWDMRVTLEKEMDSLKKGWRETDDKLKGQLNKDQE